MRKLGLRGGHGKKTITATTRQLESIIRLSEAHARMRLSSRVETQDVGEALRLIRVATQTAAIDPRTGQIDMGRLATGHAADEHEMVATIAMSLRELLSRSRRGDSLTIGQLVRDLAVATGNDNPGESEYGSSGSLAPSAIQCATAAEVLEALRLLADEENPIIRLQGGVQNARVTVMG
jgi:DNA replicative helicase MCM subunit Mcm2 (Cdc46/Mcm family)